MRYAQPFFWAAMDTNVSDDEHRKRYAEEYE
jgi:hypothetical protein